MGESLQICLSQPLEYEQKAPRVKKGGLLTTANFGDIREYLWRPRSLIKRIDRELRQAFATRRTDVDILITLAGC